MRSLPSRNIVKDAEERDVQSYDFFAGFLLKKEEEVPEEERILEEPEAEEIEYETLRGKRTGETYRAGGKTAGRTSPRGSL